MKFNPVLRAYTFKRQSEPIYNLVNSRLLIIFGFLTVATLILYWLEKRAMAKADRHIPVGAKVKVREYSVERLPWAVGTPTVRDNLRNIPVWDSELLGDVYEQLQGIRPYYDFHGIDVDRYTVNGRYQQVYLAARELNLGKLPEYAKNWINRRLLGENRHHRETPQKRRRRIRRPLLPALRRQRRKQVSKNCRTGGWSIP